MMVLLSRDRPAHHPASIRSSHSHRGGSRAQQAEPHTNHSFRCGFIRENASLVPAAWRAGGCVGQRGTERPTEQQTARKRQITTAPADPFWVSSVLVRSRPFRGVRAFCAVCRRDCQDWTAEETEEQRGLHTFVVLREPFASLEGRPFASLEGRLRDRRTCTYPPCKCGSFANAQDDNSAALEGGPFASLEGGRCAQGDNDIAAQSSALLSAPPFPLR
jgi:hypothetical protein